MFKKIVVVLAAVLLGAAGLYVNDYYRAEEGAYAALESDELVTVTVTKEQIVFAPKEIKAGLIFYPGGKVQFEAYAPLMRELAEEGVFCVLLHMPCNLAVLDANAAEGIPEEFPQVEDWYLGGHSLGGSMAASHGAKNSEDYEGLLLLASYSTADLKESALEVLSVYGSEDRVLNAESYAENRENLPQETAEVVLEGGCHAYFGAYGVQEGDGTPTMSREEQMEQTAEIFAEQWLSI